MAEDNYESVDEKIVLFLLRPGMYLGRNCNHTNLDRHESRTDVQIHITHLPPTTLPSLTTIIITWRSNSVDFRE